MLKVCETRVYRKNIQVMLRDMDNKALLDFEVGDVEEEDRYISVEGIKIVVDGDGRALDIDIPDSHIRLGCELMASIRDAVLEEYRKKSVRYIVMGRGYNGSYKAFKDLDKALEYMGKKLSDGKSITIMEKGRNISDDYSEVIVKKGGVSW